mgnify:FL=1
MNLTTATIQEALDSAVREQAEKDFKAALNEVIKILQPFFYPLSSPSDIQSAETLLKELFYVDSYGNIRIDTIARVPEAHVKYRQSRASTFFLAKFYDGLSKHASFIVDLTEDPVFNQAIQKIKASLPRNGSSD